MLTVGQGKTEIPIRSLWLLLIYASDMLAHLRQRECEAIAAGHRDADLIDAVAEVLVSEVERRLRQQLSYRYEAKSADLTRVRGKVNHLRTKTNSLMDQGRVACTFTDLSVDSPRNRFVAALLRGVSHIVDSRQLRRRCAAAAFAMQRLGVGPHSPSRAELSQDRISRHDSQDRRMLDAAHLVYDMAIPFHEPGYRVVPKLIRDEQRYRLLFQNAIYGYFRHTLMPYGWTVHRPQLKWIQEQHEPERVSLLPRMETDMVLVSPAADRQLIIEAKFTDALVENRWGKTTIDPKYMYQLYAYIMSQSSFPNSGQYETEGVLMFVAANGRTPIDETVHIQGHRIRFLSVDMSHSPREIRQRWDQCITEGP